MLLCSWLKVRECLMHFCLPVCCFFLVFSCCLVRCSLLSYAGLTLPAASLSFSKSRKCWVELITLCNHTCFVAS